MPGGAGGLSLSSKALQLQTHPMCVQQFAFHVGRRCCDFNCNSLVSETISPKWVSRPNIVLLIPVATAVLFCVIFRSIMRLPVPFQQGNDYGAWVPFGARVSVFLLAFYGLASSFFTRLVNDKSSIWQAVTATKKKGVVKRDGGDGAHGFCVPCVLGRKCCLEILDYKQYLRAARKSHHIGAWNVKMEFID